MIWAKRGHLPHWPAKLLRFVNDNKIEVEMFGDHSPGHSRFILANWNCFLYTKQHPTGSNTKKYKEKLSEAMKVVHYSFKNVNQNNLFKINAVFFDFRSRSSTYKMLFQSVVYSITQNN